MWAIITEANLYVFGEKKDLNQISDLKTYLSFQTPVGCLPTCKG